MFTHLVLATLTALQITVTDGDTIKVGEESWRLSGFDTPETFHAKCESEYRLGAVARDKLEELIYNAESVELIDMHRTGGHDRKLGELVVDGQSVATIMIPKYARPCDGPRCRKDWCAGRDAK